jgi:hypothetical protein
MDCVRPFLRDQPTRSLAEQIEVGLRDPQGGWWVRLVLDSFGYLEEEYEYSLAEVQMHFKGNYIRYRGPVFEFVTEYDPDATRSISASLWVVADLGPTGPGEPISFPRVIQVNELLHARDLNRTLPDTMPPHLDRDYVSWAVGTWAQGLRELAPDVLGGVWPPDITIPQSG